MVNYFSPKKNEAKASAINCPISLKFSTELARYIKGKPVSKVLPYLDDVIALKKHVPIVRYNSEVGHRKGSAVSGVKSGRYPIKVAGYFKKTLESAICNADVKGLDKENLLLQGAVVSLGVRRVKMQPQGRRRSRKSKATNIELLVKEIKSSSIKAPKTKTEVKKKE